jgi:predicted amidohydrolase YtcJ
LIDQDLRAIPAPDIRRARVVRTMVGGKTVFAR